jgi:hypothetical protein
MYVSSLRAGSSLFHFDARGLRFCTSRRHGLISFWWFSVRLPHFKFTLRQQNLKSMNFVQEFAMANEVRSSWPVIHAILFAPGTVL